MRMDPDDSAHEMGASPQSLSAHFWGKQRVVFPTPCLSPRELCGCVRSGRQSKGRVARHKWDYKLVPTWVL